jgi:MFS transporter, ACDE family, multidrug resistance protein
MDDRESDHRRGSMIDSSMLTGHHLRGLRGHETSSVPWGSSTVRVVFVSTLLAPLGIALLSPGLPVIQDRFALTDAQTSLIISMYFVTGIVLSPFIGLLEDRVGRRHVLVPCLLGFSVAGAAIALAPNFEVVIALRVVQGTAAAGIFITTVTVIGDTFEDVQRSAVLGANTAVLSTGAAIFPIVGGVLFTSTWNAPFLAYLLGIPVAMFAYATLEEPSIEHEARTLGSFQRVIAALSPREAALLYGSALMIELLLFGALFTAIPFLLTEEYGATPIEIGFIITAALVASAVASAETGRLARYVTDDMIIILGFAGAGLGLVGVWFANSYYAIGVSGTVFGAGWGVTLPAIDDDVSEFVSAEFRAEALSLRNSATFLGRSVAPVLFTSLATLWTYSFLLLVAGVVGFASGLLGMVLSRQPTRN